MYPVFASKVLCGFVGQFEMSFSFSLTSVLFNHIVPHNAGWLDCPASGQEIFCMIPSKVPLGESYNDCVPPGKRYSFKQVIHQQRVLGRKVSPLKLYAFFLLVLFLFSILWIGIFNISYMNIG